MSTNFISRWTFGEVKRLSTFLDGFDSRTEYQTIRGPTDSVLILRRSVTKVQLLHCVPRFICR